jgi:hypothetical protein
VNAKTIVISLAFLFVQNATAATFMLSGRVPDRGVVVEGNEVSPQENSILKVYVQEHVVRRGPQSEGAANNNSKKWKELTGSQKLASQSVIKVVAP